MKKQPSNAYTPTVGPNGVHLGLHRGELETKNPAAVALAKLSRAKPPSPARKAAAKKNGHKGGRPNATAAIIRRCLADGTGAEWSLYWVAKDLCGRGHISESELGQLLPR